jgi:hypothetical protein
MDDSEFDNSGDEYGEAMARGRCNSTVAVAGGYGD